jgi:hypothetical protein
MNEEFNSLFLNKRSSKITDSKSENQIDVDCKENTAEFKMNENFYKSIFEKLKTLCIQDKGSKESDAKSNVFFF